MDNIAFIQIPLVALVIENGDETAAIFAGGQHPVQAVHIGIHNLRNECFHSGSQCFQIAAFQNLQTLTSHSLGKIAVGGCVDQILVSLHSFHGSILVNDVHNVTEPGVGQHVALVADDFAVSGEEQLENIFHVAEIFGLFGSQLAGQIIAAVFADLPWCENIRQFDACIGLGQHDGKGDLCLNILQSQSGVNKVLLHLAVLGQFKGIHIAVAAVEAPFFGEVVRAAHKGVEVNTVLEQSGAAAVFAVGAEIVAMHGLGQIPFIGGVGVEARHAVANAGNLPPALIVSTPSLTGGLGNTPGQRNCQAHQRDLAAHLGHKGVHTHFILQFCGKEIAVAGQNGIVRIGHSAAEQFLHFLHKFGISFRIGLVCVVIQIVLRERMEPNTLGGHSGLADHFFI